MIIPLRFWTKLKQTSEKGLSEQHSTCTEENNIWKTSRKNCFEVRFWIPSVIFSGLLIKPVQHGHQICFSLVQKSRISIISTENLSFWSYCFFSPDCLICVQRVQWKIWWKLFKKNCTFSLFWCSLGSFLGQWKKIGGVVKFELHELTKPFCKKILFQVKTA